ncbi:MAG: S8 family serine peptidase [Planctomycetes bacterium]|nr:S8 family serine peptidase [Planctomycetota bacterium]
MFAIGSRAAAVPDDPLFAQQWYLTNTGQVINGTAGTVGADINAQAAWAIHAGSSSVTVAIVSSGIDAHAEYAGRVLVGRATTGDPFNTLDDCGVGTRAAGLIAALADNGVGMAGLAGEVRLLPVRVLDGCAGTAQNAADGIRWAVDHDADVIAVLVRFYGSPAVLAEAIDYAAANDVLVVGPAGHDASNEVAYPAAVEPCIAVTATDHQDLLAGYSNYGPEVDLSAPGASILATEVGGGYATADQAWWAPAALVGGAAALVRSYAPQLSAVEARRILLDSADDRGPAGPDPQWGAGRLNVARALQTTPLPPLRIEPVEAWPEEIAAGVPIPVAVRVAAGAQQVAGAWLTVIDSANNTVMQPLAPVGESVYRGFLPATPCDTAIACYFSADGHLGATIRHPANAPMETFTAYALNTSAVFDDDFEVDLGWDVVIDPTGELPGAWTRVAPVATFAAGNIPLQPGYDFSPQAGTKCFVTGQYLGGAVWTSDVDGGPMELLSPVFTIPTADAEVSYARWFHSSGDGNADFLTVSISGDGGNTWAVVETVAHEPTWVQRRFRLSQVPQFSGDSIRVRFSTADVDDDSLTEAAIDEFHVRAILCASATGDYNGNGLVDLGDFGQLARCLSGPAMPPGGAGCAVFDFDGDNNLDLHDTAALFQRFGQPTP